ncbi:MAG: hypothetical protein ACTSPI_11905, partial [Candidatus Heimdallarchaeaceae archaeon]
PIVFATKPHNEDLATFELTEEDKNNFEQFQTLRAETIDETIAPHVVGRLEAKKATLLTAHSVLEYEFKGKTRSGRLNTLFYGDTKTCKSTIVSDAISKLKLGEFLEGETSGRTGIAYTIDTDNKVIVWGSLVQNDLGLIAIDGFQQIKGEEMAQLREILEKGIVKVRRCISGDALARTRLIACANPKKNMEFYTYKCEALTPTSINFEEGFRPFKSTPDLTRWHILIPFGDKDIAIEKYLIEEYRKRQDEKEQGIIRETIDVKILRRHVLWLWSRTKEQIRFEEEAIKKILEESTSIQKEFSYSELPIVHNGFYEVVSRISIAFAGLYHSVDESHQNIIVTIKNVSQAIDYIRTMLESLELSSYAYTKKHNTTILDKEDAELRKLVNDVINEKIIEKLTLENKACSSNVLALHCGISPSTIKRRLELLQVKNLIKSKSGVGSTITDKGRLALKRYIKTGNKEEKQKDPFDPQFTQIRDAILKLQEEGTTTTEKNIFAKCGDEVKTSHFIMMKDNELLRLKNPQSNEFELT